MHNQNTPIRKRGSLKTLGIFMAVAFTLIFGSIFVAGAIRGGLCADLARNHKTVEATVVQFISEKAERGRRTSWHPATYVDAEKLTIDFRYVVDGKNYEKKGVMFSYDDDQRPYLQLLFLEAQKGTMKLAYRDGDPDWIRPAMEFEPGVPATLCR